MVSQRARRFAVVIATVVGVALGGTLAALPATAAEGAVTGVVLVEQADGTTKPGVGVAVGMRQPSGAVDVSTQTDATGSFSLSVQPSDDYVLTWGIAPSTNPNLLVGGRRTGVTVGDGGGLHLDLVVHRPSVTGTVVDAAGTAVPSARVWAWDVTEQKPADAGFYPQASTTGRFGLYFPVGHEARIFAHPANAQRPLLREGVAAFTQGATAQTQNVRLLSKAELPWQLSAEKLLNSTTNGGFPDPAPAELALSGNGRFAAFSTTAEGVTPDLGTSQQDVYLRDLKEGTTTLVSKAGDGRGDGPSNQPAVSRDGSTVVFSSRATNLVADDVDDQDVLRWSHGTLDNLSGDANGTSYYGDPHPSVSADGETVAFLGAESGNEPYQGNVYVAAGPPGAVSTTRLTDLNGTADDAVALPAVSADGSTVAYYYRTQEPGAATATWELRVFLRGSGATVRGPVVGHDAVGESQTPQSAPSLTADGGRVVVPRFRDSYYDRELVAYDVAADKATVLPDLGWAEPVRGTWECAGAVDPRISADGSTLTFLACPPDRPEGYQGAQVWSRALDDAEADATLVTAGQLGGPAYGAHANGGLSDDGDVAIFAAELNVLMPQPDYVQGDQLVVARPPSDAVPPSWPAAATLTPTSVGQTIVRLSWPAASDDSGVVTYRLFRDDAKAAEVPGSQTTGAITGLTRETSYDLRVEAVDAAGNVSTDGPRLSVTTAGDAEPGSASLEAVNDGPGRVGLTWDPAPAPAVDGYRIYRRSGDQAPVAIADVSAVTSYVDSGVPAGTQLTYHVAAVRGSEETSHTAEATVTSLPLSPLSVNAVAPTKVAPGIASLGSALTIVARGDAGRTVTATVSVDSWYDDAGSLLAQPRAVDMAVTLAEDAQTAGTYRGSFVLAEGIRKVRQVSATMTDGAGAAVSGTSTGFSVDVSASLAATVESEFDYPGGRLLVNDNTSWRGVERVVGAFAAGESVHQVPLVPTEGDAGYTVLLLTGAASSESVVVQARPGLSTPVRVAAKIPASLKVRYVGAPEVGLEGVSVAAATGGGVLGSGSLRNDDRTTQMWGTFVAGQEVTLTTTLPAGSQVPVRHVDAKTVALTPGENTVDLPVEALPGGVVAGTVRTPAGGPAGHAGVTLVQRVDERDWQFSTQADEQGHYELNVLQAPAHLSASFRDETQRRDISVGTEASTADFEMTDPRRYQVELDLETRLPGSEDFTRTNVDWRVAVHFGLRATVNGSRAQAINEISRERENTFPVEGRRGEELTVCGSGGEASGLPRTQSCGTVVLGDPDATPVVRVDFSAASAIQARLRDTDGQPLQERWTASVVRLTAEGPVPTTTFSSSGDRLEAAIEAPGEYELTVRMVDDPTRKVVRTVTVGPDPVDLGDLQLVGGGQFAAHSTVIPGATLVAPGASIPMTATLHNGGGVAADVEALLQTAVGASVAAGSVTVDGKQVTTHDGDAGEVVVPLGDIAADATVKVGYTLRSGTVPPASALVTDVAIRWADKHELIGSSPVTVAGVTLDVPRVVTTSTVRASGRAPAGADVELYDGGALIGSTTAGAGGFWSVAAGLADRGVQPRHSLTARAPATGERAELRSETSVVRFDPDEPVLTKVVIRNEGNGPGDRRSYEYDPRKGVARFPFVFVPGQPLEVEATFSHGSRVSGVVAHVGPRRAEAVPTDSGSFLANLGSVGELGDISFDYQVAPVPVDLSQPLSSADLRASLPPRMADFATVAGPTEYDGGVRGAYTAPALEDEPAKQISYDFTSKDVSYTPTDEDLAVQAATGVPVWGLEVEHGEDGSIRFTAYLPQAGAGGAPASGRARAAAAPQIVRKIGGVLKETFADTGDPVGTAANWGALAYNTDGAIQGPGTPFAALFDKIELLAQHECADQAEMDRLRGEANLALDTAQFWFWASMPIAAGLDGVGSILPGQWGLAATAAGVGFDMVLGQKAANEAKKVDDQLRLMAPNCPGLPKAAREKIESDDPGSDDRSSGPSGSATGIIDPAGYVYSGVTSNRLSGVTAVLLGAAKADEPLGQWDAPAYGQENPLTTDTEGRYAWFVPRGFYQVLYSADGYRPAQSSVLEVEPPHYDVNVGLVPTAAPSVTGFSSEDGKLIVAFDQYMDAATITPSTFVVNDGDGQPLAGEVTALDADKTPAGLRVARRFAFDPVQPVAKGETVTVAIDSTVRSFAASPMAAGAAQQVVVDRADPVNQPPVAAPDTASTVAGKAVVLDVLANDTDADGDSLSLAAVTTPSGGATAVKDGKVIYTPKAGFTGNDAFSYTVQDGRGGSASGQVTVAVQPSPGPSAACRAAGAELTAAKAALGKAQKVLKKAKVKLKKAKKTKKPAAVKRASKALKKAKAKVRSATVRVSTATAAVRRLC